MRRREWLLATGLVLSALLPVIGKGCRRAAAGCAFDGAPIQPLYHVRVLGPRGSRSFCCVRCAGWWLEREPARSPRVLVTDEAAGKEIPAARAYFVRSSVVTNPVTGNRVHAFARLQDARRHAALYGGVLLESVEKPFGGEEP